MYQKDERGMLVNHAQGKHSQSEHGRGKGKGRTSTKVEQRQKKVRQLHNNLMDKKDIDDSLN